jgi:hypothetical protein
MAEEVQINANDILAAFATEVASLMQRVVVAELQVKALRRALKETQTELATELSRVRDDGPPTEEMPALSFDEPTPVP